MTRTVRRLREWKHQGPVNSDPLFLVTGLIETWLLMVCVQPSGTSSKAPPEGATAYHDGERAWPVPRSPMMTEVQREIGIEIY